MISGEPYTLALFDTAGQSGKSIRIHSTFNVFPFYIL